jgi:lipopolysaccharide/colanic/teichoic acid biosynthesis glycosyltransferase
MLVETKPLPIVSPKASYLIRKRIIDVLFILLIFIPLCLVITIVAICIRLDSKGPVFFRQKRVGQNGKEFTMLKFRSMYVDNDDAIHREVIKRYMSGEAINGESYKLMDDPRITKVGRFIRKTSIDELPQFFNVLRGEMTLVGPRPPLPYEVECYRRRDWIRLTGKPGLTGTWQVYGRSRVQFQEMVEMDIMYLQKQSTLRDLKLVCLTPIVMLSGRGGY